MTNPVRGEVALTVDGVDRVMRLTLGGLAELETTLEAGSLIGLAERFESGTVQTADLLSLLGVGLRGGGLKITDAELAEAEIGGGAIAALRAGIELMRVSFTDQARRANGGSDAQAA